MEIAPRAGETGGVRMMVTGTNVRIAHRRRDNMADLGKFLVLLGGLLVIVGMALVALGRTNLPLGRLPGDIIYRGKNTTFYFPLATSLLISVVLSIVLYVLGRWKK